MNSAAAHPTPNPEQSARSQDADFGSSLNEKDSQHSAKNPVFGDVEPSVQKRINGCTPLSGDSENPLDPSHINNVHAHDSSGSCAAVSETAAEDSFSDAAVDVTKLDIPGADFSDDVAPLLVESTVEQLEEVSAFFEAAKAAESPGQLKRARIQSRVFSVMQYRQHPETGEIMLTQEQIDEGLATLADRVHKYAYVWHDRDRLVAVDEGTGEPFCVGIKGLHAHLVLWMTEDRPTIRTVSDAFSIPAARVKPPREIAAQDGIDEHKGRNAAEKAFFDLSEYLVHESRGRSSLPGVHQPERHYLVDKTQDGNPGKYQYGRGRVVANFDFSKELDAHMAGRKSAAEGATSLRSRKVKLRRAVMDGMPLREAREKDRDAYADDLPRLEKLAREYEEISGQQIASQIGSVWRKSLVVATGRTRAGKDTLLGELASQLTWLAKLAGFSWYSVSPAGKNTLEGVGRAEIVHHEDMRYKLLPGYDEALRYFDPNQAVEAGTRFTNTAAPTPRLIMVSSSETLYSLGYTLKRRMTSEYLAEVASDPQRRPRHPLDIDEFLYRVAWHVEVSKPEGAGDDVEVIRDGMMVAISRVREGTDEPRIQRVTTRGGEFIGGIRTQHTLEPVAVIRGCENAARFLALSIVQERNPDVVESMPDDRWDELSSGREAIVEGAHAEQMRLEAAREAAAELAEIHRERQALRDAEERRRAQEAAERERELATLQHQVRAHENAIQEQKQRLDARYNRVLERGGLFLDPSAKPTPLDPTI